MSTATKPISIDLGQSVTLEMVAISGGTFLMGSPPAETGRYNDEGPQHQVTLSAFSMGRYPVTQGQYQAIMGNNPSHFKGNNRPVEQVSWNDAMEFCDRLSAHTQQPYTLPSEAQWEYACRAGTTTPFHFGDTITTDLANYNGENTFGFGPKVVFRGETTEVGSFLPNSFGLYDMHGNVWEWCLDHWHKGYKGAPADGSAWVIEGDSYRRILRGGSWRNRTKACRSAYRMCGNLDDRFNSVGFRVVSVPFRTFG